MFDRISGVYDPMNLVISAFQEPRWRRRAVASAALGPGGRAVDVATGTGKVAADLLRSAAPGGGVLGVDISEGMIGIARERGSTVCRGLRSWWVTRLALPAADDALRRGHDRLRHAQPARLHARLRRDGAGGAAGRQGGLPGDRPAAQPRGPPHAWWFDRIVPLIGKVAGQGAAYAYLVRSVQNYPAPERIAEVMREAGLVGIRWIGMSGGIVTIHVGTVPPKR